ncbi:hypothetical protein ZYGNAAKF_CDS0034 [Enterococcus phage VRE9_2]
MNVFIFSVEENPYSAAIFARNEDEAFKTYKREVADEPKKAQKFRLETFWKTNPLNLNEESLQHVKKDILFYRATGTSFTFLIDTSLI